jgi:hypothetical protein
MSKRRKFLEELQRGSRTAVLSVRDKAETTESLKLASLIFLAPKVVKL